MQIQQSLAPRFRGRHHHPIPTPWVSKPRRNCPVCNMAAPAPTLKHRVSLFSLVPGTRYRTQGTRCLVPMTRNRAPATWHQVSRTSYQAPGTKYQGPGTRWCKVPSTGYHLVQLGTKRLVNGTWYLVHTTRLRRCWPSACPWARAAARYQPRPRI